MQNSALMLNINDPDHTYALHQCSLSPSGIIMVLTKKAVMLRWWMLPNLIDLALHWRWCPTDSSSSSRSQLRPSRRSTDSVSRRLYTHLRVQSQ